MARPWSNYSKGCILKLLSGVFCIPASAGQSSSVLRILPTHIVMCRHNCNPRLPSEHLGPSTPVPLSTVPYLKLEVRSLQLAKSSTIPFKFLCEEGQLFWKERRRHMFIIVLFVLIPNTQSSVPRALIEKRFVLHLHWVIMQ